MVLQESDYLDLKTFLASKVEKGSFATKSESSEIFLFS